MWDAGVRAGLQWAANTCLDWRDNEHSPPSDREEQLLTDLHQAILRIHPVAR